MATFVNHQTVTKEHAVLFQEVPNCPHLIDYVKAVASAIGSSHIQSVVKSGDKIKLYLDEKKYVDYIIGAGVMLREHHTKPEYASPPAAHVLVLNVDPMVPDDLVVTSLSQFGVFKSNVIRPTLSEDSEYCHILTGERRVYMKLFEQVEIPDTLTVEFNGSKYKISLEVETTSRQFSPRITAVKSNVACVNPVQEGSCQTAVNEKDLLGSDKDSESNVDEHAIKVENKSAEGMEQDDDLFHLFSKVNDWDNLISNDCGQECDQPKSEDKLSTKSSVNVCSVKPMQSSHVNCETEVHHKL